MRKKYSISVRKAGEPISKPITKLGGRPTWISGVQWPLSKATGHPMRFIAQFSLAPELFGDLSVQMAYVFMTDEETYVDGTWLPDGEENAVILQPDRWDDSMAIITDDMPHQEEHYLTEYEVILHPDEDPDYLDEEEYRQRGDWKSFLSKVYESKIGGTPAFLQYPEYPDAGKWVLIAQLASTLLPNELNFGDSGVGYVFLSESGERAKFLWQG